LAGCQYYRVTDPTSGRTYITNNWAGEQYRWNGAIEFDDLGTGKHIVLQSSEMEKIDENTARDAIAQEQGTKNFHN
jgi:hypothetical protein